MQAPFQTPAFLKKPPKPKKKPPKNWRDVSKSSKPFYMG